jgi:hypothetical protein
MRTYVWRVSGCYSRGWECYFYPSGSVMQICAFGAREERQRKIAVFQERRDEIMMMLRLLWCLSLYLGLGF